MLNKISPRQLVVPLAVLLVTVAGEQLFTEEPLSVAADSEVGSIAPLEIDQARAGKFKPYEL